MRRQSPTRSRVADEMSRRDEQEGRGSRRVTNPSINHWKYFCHYNNAVYQGGMSAYKKHGRGLLLHDDGAAVVTEYLHDTPSGHNIIFRDNSIASVLYKTASEYEVAYKAARCILKVPFEGDNPHGVGVLIDYQTNKIYELVWKRGALTEKILHLNRKNNEDAFKRASIAKLVGLKHEQAFALTFEKPDTMHIKQAGNELTIGYFDSDGEVHGLAFRMYAENLEVSGTKALYLKSIERGYYKASQLETYGEKFFSNGNKYVGEFEKGQFHGHGILVCPQEMKWVYGRFANGKLAEVVDSNNRRFTENDFQMWNEALLDVHRRYRERYIDFTIYLPDELQLYSTLKDALRLPVTEVDPDREEIAKEDEYRMGRIQQQFEEGFPGDSDRSYVDAELEKHYTVRTGKHISRIDRTESTPRANRIDPHVRIEPPNKPPIYIEDPHRSKERLSGEETPIGKLASRPTPKHSPPSSADRERHYRMQDPFQIELVKVPMEERAPHPTTPHRDHRDPIKEDYDRPAISLTDSRTMRPLRYSEEVPSSVQSAYRRAYFDELERQRDLYRRLEREDQDYISYLRSGISRSPVHRDYYSTPPKYDPANKRYNGRIINKKNFNYDDPTPPRRSSREPERDSYLREPERDNYFREPQTYYPRNPSPKKTRQPSPSSLGNAPYRSRENLGNSRSFIENNYQNWR